MIPSVTDEFKDDFDLSDLGLANEEKQASPSRATSHAQGPRISSIEKTDDSAGKIVDLALVGEFLGLAAESLPEKNKTQALGLNRFPKEASPLVHLSPTDFVPEDNDDPSDAEMEDGQTSRKGDTPLFNFEKMGASSSGEENILDIDTLILAPVQPSNSEKPAVMPLAEPDILNIEDLLPEPDSKENGGLSPQTEAPAQPLQGNHEKRGVENPEPANTEFDLDEFFNELAKNPSPGDQKEENRDLSDLHTVDIDDLFKEEIEKEALPAPEDVSDEKASDPTEMESPEKRLSPVSDEKIAEVVSQVKEGEDFSKLLSPEAVTEDATMPDAVEKDLVPAVNLPISVPELEAMLEKIVRKVLSEKIDAALVAAVEKAVAKEFQALTHSLYDEES